MDLGKRIRDRREELNLSQEELAKKLGYDLINIGFSGSCRMEKEVADELYVTQKTVSRWENGEGIPDIAIITSVAEFYDITVDELLKGEKNTCNESPRTTERKNKSKVKLITNKLLSIQNIYFIVSMAILSCFLLAGILVVLLVDDSDINFLAGIIIITFGMIIGLVSYLYGKSEVNRILNDEDNKELMPDLRKTKIELRRKNVWFLDVYLVLLTIYFSFILWVLSELTNIYFQSYDNFMVVGFIELISLIVILAYIYISFRKLYLLDKFYKNEINKVLLSTLKVCVFISIFTLFLSVYDWRYKLDHGYKYDRNIGLNIFLLFNSNIAKKYIFRSIAIILFLFSLVFIVLGCKKSNVIFQIISFGLGGIANFLIPLDLIYFNKYGWNFDEIKMTSIGYIATFMVITISIYLLISNRKNKSIV